MSSPSTALAIKNVDLQALVGSKFYHPLANGIEFQTHKDGTLVDIPKADVDALVDSILKFRQADNWWVGDTGNVISTLWGQEELVKFADKINMDIDQLGKYMSVSRAFGWPNEIKELRHPDTKTVTHRHHQLVQGVKDRRERMRLLNIASKKEMSSGQFYEMIKALGTSNSTATGSERKSPELGVFKPALGIFDPKVESEEQFVQRAINKIKEEFPYYAHPEMAKQREERTAKYRAVYANETSTAPAKGLSQEQANQLWSEAENFTVEGFRARVKRAKEEAAVTLKIRNYVNAQVTSQDARDKIFITAKDFDAAKKAVSDYKAAQRAIESNATKNERLAAKVQDKQKRQELLDRAAAESLTPEQFTPLVNAVLTEELLEKERGRIAAKAAKQLGAGGSTRKKTSARKSTARKR